jgi:hypothetical protein
VEVGEIRRLWKAFVLQKRRKIDQKDKTNCTGGSLKSAQGIQLRNKARQTQADKEIVAQF